MRNIICVTLANLLLINLFMSNPVQAQNTQTLVRGNNGFSLELYKKLDSKEKNIFFSPISITTAFAMVYLGAKNETAKEISKTLNYNMPADSTSMAFNELTKQMNQSAETSKITLEIANMLWGQKGSKLLKSYLTNCKKYFGASLRELDFLGNSSGSADIINKWVSDKTNNKIKNLVNPALLKGASLVLTNAVYFYGNWDIKFKKDNTRKEKFYISEKNTFDTDMMHQTEKFNYGKFNNYAVLELPYKNKSMSMFILLPDKINGLNEMEKNLSNDDLENSLNNLEKTKVNITLPKFKIEYSTGLSDILSKMGMTSAFGPKADFSGMTGSKGLFISSVIHKAFIDVNEEGTEAAAATAIIMTKSMPMPEKTKDFKADHPFMFMIRDNSSGCILFMGNLLKP